MQSISSKHYNNFKKITINWEGKFYSALAIKFIYKQNHVDISIPGDIQKYFHKSKTLYPFESIIVLTNIKDLITDP